MIFIKQAWDNIPATPLYRGQLVTFPKKFWGMHSPHLDYNSYRNYLDTWVTGDTDEPYDGTTNFDILADIIQPIEIVVILNCDWSSTGYHTVELLRKDYTCFGIMYEKYEIVG